MKLYDRIPKRVMLKADKKWYEVVEITSTKITLEDTGGKYLYRNTDDVYIPPYHLGKIELLSEEDSDTRLEFIWANSKKEAVEFFEDNIFMHPPNSPYDCTGRWFTMFHDWKPNPSPNIYIVKHTVACDV